jgi:RNA polymerase sigma-70 factor (ECF subfamily)
LKDVEEALRASFLLALAGDNEAYAAFLTQSSGHVRAYFRRRLVAFPDDVEDLVQETLLAVHNRRHTYRASEPVTPWLYAIARYKLVDLLRVQSPRRAVEIRLDDEDAGEIVVAAADAGGADSRRDLLKLLESLPERQRLAIVLVKLEGRSVAEAAAATGMSQAAVKVGIHRGLKRLAAEAAKQR